MGSSSSGGGGVPPGFRFHPTDEELLHFYLKKKVSFQKFDMEVIREVDLNKIEPWDLQERCKIGSTPQNEWYFFSHKDRKYPTGSRTNRATTAGFWKATGRDKCIRSSFNKIGMRKTLVFYRGRAPHGQKTDWIMHEYRLEDPNDHHDPQPTHEDGWVVCRVFKKKNLFKVGSSTATDTSHEGGGHHNNNIDGTGMMMMINTCEDDQLNSSSTSPSTGFNQCRPLYTYRDQMMNMNQYKLQQVDHGSLVNYSQVLSAVSAVSPQHEYPQLEAQNFILNQNHKPLMLSNTPNTYDHQFISSAKICKDQDCDYQGSAAAGYNQSNCEAPAAGIERCDQSSHQAAAANRSDDDHNNLNEWDRLVITTSDSHHRHHHHHETSSSKGIDFHDDNIPTSSVNQISQLSLRSEMDFWAYGK